MDDIHVIVAPWQLLTFGVGLLITLIGALFAVGKFFLAQLEERQSERFAAQESNRNAVAEIWAREFAALKAAITQEGQAWRQVERDLMALKADLPLNYVRREDWVRNQTIIEAKIDGLALRIENAQLKGSHGHS